MLPNDIPLRVDLRRWLTSAFEHEPAHGHFVRLAALNSAHSTRVFADACGLNGRNFDLGEMLAFCMQFPMRDKGNLVRATPTFDGDFIFLNGQKFRRRTHWSMSQPRVCEACLGEGRYYRNWWDLSLIGRCPLHERPLVAGSPSAELAWWCPDIGLTTSGQYLGNSGPIAIGPRYESWDRYVLARMGITERFDVPVLDQTELYAVAEAAELVGRAAASGWSEKRPLFLKMHGEERRVAMARGFMVLRDGEAGLHRFIEDFMRPKAITCQAATPTFGYDDFFGWLSCASRVLPSSPIGNLIKRTMLAFAGSAGVHSRKRQLSVAVAKGKKRKPTPSACEKIVGHRPMTLNELAAKFKLAPRKMREIATNLGLIEPTHRRIKPHFFRQEAVDRVELTLRDLLARRPASERLGLSLLDFQHICVAGIIRPFVRLHGPTLMFDQFRRSELDTLIYTVRSNANAQSPTQGISISDYCAATKQGLGLAVTDLVSGKITAIGWDESSRGFLSTIMATPPDWMCTQVAAYKSRARSNLLGIPICDAAIQLGVKPIAVSPLVEAGHLSLMSNDSGKKRPRIESESLRRFGDEYAPAKIYAGALACGRSHAYPKLKRMGICRIEGKAGVANGSFVSRAAVRRLLRLSRDPDANGAELDDGFWAGQISYFAQSRSNNRVFRIDNLESAQLNSGGQRAGACVVRDFARNQIQLVVECNRRCAPAKFKFLLARWAELAELMSAAEFSLDQDRHELRLVDTLVVEVGNSQTWPKIYEWVDRRMTVLKGVLTKGRRTAYPPPARESPTLLGERAVQSSL